MKPLACCFAPSAAQGALLSSFAQEAGWETNVCSNLAEIEHLFAQDDTRLDLVISTGSAVTENLANLVARVRAHASAESTPIVVFGKEIDGAQAQRALESGITEVFYQSSPDAFRTYLQSFFDEDAKECLGKYVLVLDDDRIQGKYLEGILSKNGFVARVFDSSDEALASTATINYDAIISDIVLGLNQSGLSFIRQLRQSNSRSAKAPIIAISGFADDTRRIEALRAGAASFLPKPVAAAELCLHLRRLLRSSPLSPPLEQPRTFEADLAGKLSEREQLICALTVAGHRDKQIAHQIGISYWTVRTYLARIFRKFSVTNRIELAASVHATDAGEAPRGQVVSEAKTAVIHWLSLAPHIIDQIPHGVMVTDKQSNILQVNEAFSEITGYSRSEVLGKTPRLFRSKRQDKGFYARMFAELLTSGAWSGEVWNRNKSGEDFLEKLDICSLPPGLPMNAAYVAVISDITEQHRKAQGLRESALRDPLTGVANRLLLKDRAQLEISRARRSGRRIAVAFIDLDGFKPINDTHGHAMGDEILQEVAARLSACLRENDTLARIGGDEFVALLPDVTSRDTALMLGERLIKSFSVPFGCGDRHDRLGASIGISLYPDDGQDFDTLLARADTAMYRAKQAGGRRVSAFEWHMHESGMPVMAEETRLSLGLKNGEFELLFQPQLDLVAGDITGAEALLRWHDPQNGLQAAAQFIALAEKSGVIVELGNWVLHQACAILAGIQKKMQDVQSPGRPEFRLSINISPLQILRGDAFVDDVRAALTSSPIEANTLELEISEAVFLRNPQQAVETLKALLACGVSLALDGFGKDHFSPGYLRHLDFRAIKIDRGCIGSAHTDNYHASIARSSLLLAADLGLDAIAEGVETREQRTFLENIGYRHAQGNLFGKPMPLEQLLRQIDCRD